ncbi:hypothetical protein H6G20_07885 [Desertifilum sp. FACHB-1129]|uniref:Uncharacterized protein n=2 Tax=Desertifilum tharense IPPAS B-1220 TaxID=1781255 RepID=A0A1E5QMA6_9CYAN|nr:MULTISPECIES: hypothetical protein [Desertifilum]MDA0210576.1 hypothetical protein [Cyanobacteria bacterium FC1]MBD2311577.1 hypothetical protein [Desertifilum sp. FACHB-1129]MBD2323151.1 hypothetical protein [Desertifilum sp. FACHB-866]MBD2332996.1 hypothetical protein [Desertifilum sp. FACHB-868]OEJ75822.1 hypothetical protein BH720_07795 [Desertifilum tharense IPPAS B-1220]
MSDLSLYTLAFASQGQTVAELVFQVCRTGTIDYHHRQLLQSFLLQEHLTEEDHTAIDRLLYAVRRGWLQIVD